MVWVECPASTLVLADLDGLGGFYKADPMGDSGSVPGIGGDAESLIALAPPLWLSVVLAAKSLMWTVQYFGAGRLRLFPFPFLTPSPSLLPGHSLANDALRDVMNLDGFL